MDLPPSDLPIQPDTPEISETQPVPVARRRRTRRPIIPLEAGARAEFLEGLARHVSPSPSFYIVSILAGLIVAAAILFDSPALFVLAALLAPFMGPLMGISLAAVLGSLGFFLRSLVGVLVGGALVFALGVVGGIISLQMPGYPFTQVIYHTRFTLPDVIILLLGASLTAYLLVRSQNKPLASSIALAYELYLPLGAAGFGLANPLPGLFPEGLLLFASNLAVAVLVGILVMALLGLRPLSAAGYTLGSSIFLVVLAAVLAFAAIGQGILSSASPAPLPQPTATPSPMPSPSALPTLALPTQTPQPPTLTPLPTPLPSATATFILTATPTETLAPSPTPVWGLINAGEANGAIIRPEPGSFEQVTSLLNGNLVQILPETVNRGGVIWLHVRTLDGKEGWVPAVLIVTATPRPR